MLQLPAHATPRYSTPTRRLSTQGMEHAEPASSAEPAPSGVVPAGRGGGGGCCGGDTGGVGAGAPGAEYKREKNAVYVPDSRTMATEQMRKGSGAGRAWAEATSMSLAALVTCRYAWLYLMSSPSCPCILMRPKYTPIIWETVMLSVSTVIATTARGLCAPLQHSMDGRSRR